MVSISLTETIKASTEKVFGFISDFENAPKYSNYWKSVKPVKREDNSVTYETMAEAEGRKINSVTRITSRPNERLDTETMEGDGKGTRMSFILSGVPEGTQLTLQGEMVLPGFAKMLGSIVKGRIEAGMRAELGIIKKTLEA